MIIKRAWCIGIGDDLIFIFIENGVWSIEIKYMTIQIGLVFYGYKAMIEVIGIRESTILIKFEGWYSIFYVTADSLSSF